MPSFLFCKIGNTKFAKKPEKKIKNTKRRDAIYTRHEKVKQKKTFFSKIAPNKKST
jgi:hypothetical protein